jgi:hypothetical protein
MRNVAFALTLMSVAAAGFAASAQPIPRLSNGRPDLNGVWDNGGGIHFVNPKQLAGGSICVRDCETPGTAPQPRAAPDRPKYRPEHTAKVQDLDRRQVQFDPALRCKPPGVPRIGPPDKIVQTAREVVFLYEDIAGTFYRVIPTDGRKHDPNVEESYLGHSIGYWEKDTLVVDTIAFNDDTWLTDDGTFHTRDLRVVERLERVGNEIRYQAIAYDDKVLAEPWRLAPRVLKLTDAELPAPVPCVEEDLDHVVDGTHHDNVR